MILPRMEKHLSWGDHSWHEQMEGRSIHGGVWSAFLREPVYPNGIKSQTHALDGPVHCRWRRRRSITLGSLNPGHEREDAENRRDHEDPKRNLHNS